MSFRPSIAAMFLLLASLAQRADAAPVLTPIPLTAGEKHI